VAVQLYRGQRRSTREAQKPELVARATIPDVLLGAHVAPLQLRSIPGSNFRRTTAAARSSPNTAREPGHARGYQIAFVAFKDGKPRRTCAFMTGLLPDPKDRMCMGGRWA